MPLPRMRMKKATSAKLTAKKSPTNPFSTKLLRTNRLTTILFLTTSNPASSKTMPVPTKPSVPTPPKCTTMLITRRSASRIPTPPHLRIFRPITILRRTTRHAPAEVVIAPAKVMAEALIAVVTAVVTAAEVGVGVAVADAIAGVGLRAQAWAAAICLLRNTLPLKVANLAEMSREATIIADATREARKIAVASRVVLNLVVPRNAALIIVRLKLSVPPLPALPRKNPFFFPASLWQSIAVSLSPRLLRPLLSRNHTSLNPKLKRRPPVHQAD